MSKLVRACMALAAFAAFAVLPATAAATNDPQLTHPAGTLLAPGTLIKATSVGATEFTNTAKEPLVTCSSATMTGTLLKNSGGSVEGTITTSNFQGTGAVAAHNGLPECTGSFGNAWITVVGDLCVRSTPTMATHEFQVSRGGCPGEGNPRFIIGSTTIGECEYETGSSVKGDYTTGEDTVMTVRHTAAGSGSSKIRGGFFCPSSGMLKMSFTLETDTTKSADPIGIS